MANESAARLADKLRQYATRVEALGDVFETRATPVVMLIRGITEVQNRIEDLETSLKSPS